MIHHLYSRRAILALLIAVVTVTIGAGFSTSTYAAKDGITQPPQVNEQKKLKIRKEEEKALRLKNKQHAKYANLLAKQYQETAKIVKEQGGDPKPLLDAAAYFRNQAK